MNVYLTFDIEIWCDGWEQLDAKFPAAFQRYVYGRSRRGDFALPATLDIMQRHGLRGVFFVEPLFSARFGQQYLSELVGLIDSADQDVQLHLHTEWVDEIEPPPLADTSRKRQHLTYYSFDEQVALLQYGRALLQPHTRTDITAFRAGSFAADLTTYRALNAAGILIDSSLNRVFDVSGGDVPAQAAEAETLTIEGVQVYPVTVFTDGLGRSRPAQVGACGLLEMRRALELAAAAGNQHFVIVSHNFEMLRPGRTEPDPFVVRRFEGLCRYLSENRDRYNVVGFVPGSPTAMGPCEPRVGAWPTIVRLGEQMLRRVY